MAMYRSERTWSRSLALASRVALVTLALLLLLTGSLTSVAAQTATIVRFEDTEIEADGSGAVPIALEGSPGIVAMHIEIIYDPEILEWQELEQGDLLADGVLIEANAEVPGRVVIGFATLDGVSGDGELILANFASTGTEETTTVALENVEAWDSEGFDVLIETQAGQVEIGSGFPLWLILLVLGILILLFLLVAGLLIWFLRRRSRRDREDAAAPTQAHPAPQAQPQGGQAAQPGQARFCSSCGQPLNPGAAFCSSCGAQVGQSGSRQE